jgi:hypothetical protein
MMRTLPAILILLAACHARDDAPISTTGHGPALAHASQADLARELDDADRLGTWSDVRHRWQGQAVEWTVTRHRLLCRSEAACHVAAFPVQRPAQRGWLPALSFAPGEYAKLDAACGQAERCEVVIGATVGKLDVSGELPTSVQLVNVRVEHATAG